MDEAEKLKLRREELQKQLSDPEILKDPKRVKELSIEYGRVEKELAGKKGNETNGISHQKVIMEIRAGAGGNEASLFAGELFRMYNSFIKKQQWEVALIDSSPTTLGGFKEVIFEISGNGAYDKLKNESGVHRVQRIPETEKSGRIHTSTASVAVLPEAKEEDIEIKPQDIKIEFFRSSGPGGQNVNKVETGVRLIHLPTGLVVSSQESRSQQKNREHAMTVLRTKLAEAKRLAEEAKIAKERKQQIGTAERVEKIRTYNFPQDRVTDHRIKKSWHNIQSVMEGNLDSIVECFSKS
ncbi:MAG: PCRF domain-containing protein [Candidatus Sungbacteria bacterium]|nr:PCRF domain-containing protein [Candidatus Sungbacteria bacterium]